VATLTQIRAWAVSTRPPLERHHLAEHSLTIYCLRRHPMTDVLFWRDYPHGNDTAEHKKYGVGPASDYGTPIGTPVAAPFAGRLEAYWTTEGGNSLRLIGADYIFCAQHLQFPVKPRQVGWRDVIATTGNTGSMTSGPHIHCYIIVRATGQRISFFEWLRDYVKTQPSTPAPSQPATPTPQGIVGKTFTTAPTGAYWYRTDVDAANTRNPRGGKYGGGNMLQGAYTVNAEGAGGAFLVTSQSVGRVWVSPLLRGRIA
jgi:hypothetical protein